MKAELRPRETAAELRIFRFADDDAAEWDDFVADAPMATFLHSRRFISYHRDRFVDRSLLLRDARSRLVGVFPAATDPTNEGRVVSHPGITYGGIVHRGVLAGAAMVRAVREIGACYARDGFKALRYQAVPGIYHERPSDDDVYALLSLGARLFRCDLSCAIDLSDRGRRNERRRRAERKASEHGVEVAVGSEHVAELWNVLEENLETRHAVRPTHTLTEMRSLVALFPESIEIATAHNGGSVVAGVVLFKTKRVVHAQYIAANAEGRRTSALDLLLEHCITKAASSGARFFDFGTSTEDEGRVLNTNLHTFKSEFGGGGVVHTFYDLDTSA